MILTQKQMLLASAAIFAALSGPVLAADLPDEPIAPSIDQAPVEDQIRFYLSGFGGINFAGEADLDGIVNGAPNSVDTESDAGFNIGGAVGVQLQQYGAIRPRLEFEISYQQADIDEIFFSGNGAAAEVNVDGDISSTFFFANALFDVPNVGGSAFTPFVGGGVGLAITDFDFSYGNGIRVDDTDTGFAAQAIVGFSYDLTDDVALTLDGRYTRIFDVESPRFNGAGASTGTISGDVDNFSLNAGFRYKF